MPKLDSDMIQIATFTSNSKTIDIASHKMIKDGSIESYILK